MGERIRVSIGHVSGGVALQAGDLTGSRAKLGRRVWGVVALLFAAVALLVVPDLVAQASFHRVLDDNKRCSSADVVVVAKVVERRSFHDPAAFNAVVTEAVFRPESAVHGRPEHAIRVSVLGGRIGRQRFVVGGSPWIRLGDRYLLFLDAQVIQGMKQYILLSWFQLNPSLRLPSEEAMRMIWAERCVGGDGPGGSAAAELRSARDR